MRPTDTYRNNWADDIKVEIPDTGVSIGEYNRYLRAWLGHETRISGAIYRTPDGVAVTVRAGDTLGETYMGAEKDLPALMQRAAESVFAATQPYRYCDYLETQKRYKEEYPILHRLRQPAGGAALGRGETRLSRDVHRGRPRERPQISRRQSGA